MIDLPSAGRQRAWHSQLKLSLLATASFVFAATSTAATAQQTGTAGGTAVEELVVTAQKRAERLQDVPLAVSALGEEAIRQQNIQEPAKLSLFVPSLNFNNFGGNTQITLRGVGLEISNISGEPSVAVFTDGVYEARAFTGAAIFEDLERIEVLRGPQGTLYGRNATAGAIKFISKSPSFEPSFDGAALVGSYGRYQVQAGVTGPLIGNVLAGRLFAYYSDEDGPTRNVQLGGIHQEGGEDFTVRGSLLYRPAETLQVVLRGDYTNNVHTGPVYHTTSVAPPPDGLGITPFNQNGFFNLGLPLALGSIDSRHVRQAVNAKGPFRSSGGSLDITWSPEANPLGVTQLKSITASRLVSYGHYADLGGTSQPYVITDSRGWSRWWTQEFNLLGTLGRLDYTVGAFYLNEHGKADYSTSLPGFFPAIKAVTELALGLPPGSLPPNFLAAPRLKTGIVDPNPFSDTLYYLRTTSAAGFAEFTYHATDALGVTAGIRYTKDKKRTEQTIRSNLGGGCTAERLSRSWDAWTPKLGVQYKVNADVMLYAQASRGFKGGGIAVGACGDDFDPEFLWSYEAGAKTTWLNGAMTLNATAFKYNYKDVQYLNPVGTITGIENAVSADIYGAELELVARPTRQLRIDGNIGYSHGRYGDFEAVDPSAPQLGLQNIGGNRIAKSPDWTGNAGIQYELPIGDLGGLTLRYEAAYRGSHYFSVFNSSASKQKEYWIQNARVSFAPDNARYELSAFVENFTNDQYFIQLYPNSAVNGATGSYGEPRTWGIRLDVHL